MEIIAGKVGADARFLLKTPLLSEKICLSAFGSAQILLERCSYIAKIEHLHLAKLSKLSGG